jgi:hypothetical protein
MKLRGTAVTRRGLARRGFFLPALASLAIVVAVLGPPTSAKASSTGIDQIQINGSAPNPNGTGLQISASITLPQGSSQTQAGYLPPDTTTLTVTNKSSSYTDIKKIDGVGNGSPLPLNSVTTKSQATTCTAGGGSFSCPGLAIPPGQSVQIYLSNHQPGGPQQYFGQGLASLNVIYDSIEVNGSPMNPQGKGLQVTAITKSGSCPDLGYSSTYCLTVTDLPSSGTPMTAVTGDPNSPPANASAAQISAVHAEFGFGFSSSNAEFCGLDGAAGFDCPAPFGASPQEYGFDFSDPSFASGLGDIQVSFQSTPCENSAQASSAAAIARAAAGNCTPPSHTRITQATINQKKQTAFFKFTAHGTKKFICELLLDGHVLHYRACTSPKFYANRMKKGKYVFRVTGSNQGGVDQKPAKMKFTVR